jgi:peptide/nickel transport system permease protein
MPSTARWLLRRLLLAVAVIFATASVAFAALHLTPGDPVRVLLGATEATPQAVAQVTKQLGYDKPVLLQYLLFLGRLCRGDLGWSYQLHEPVTQLVGGQLLATAELAVVAFALALAFALVLALSTAGRRPWLRRTFTAAELVMISTPGFWLGELLLTVFSFRLNLFPVVSGSSPAGLVLPAVTLALGLAGVFAQVMREGLEQALDEPFVLSSRARGTGESGVRLHHALRHAMVPIVTLSGWVVGSLLGGAVLVETIFSRQGIGRVMAQAIAGRDLPTVTGIAIVGATVFSLVNLLVDLVYVVIDPRLKEAGR